MKISNRDVDDILARVRQPLQDDQTLSVSLRTTLELLIALIQILTAPEKPAAKASASLVGSQFRVVGYEKRQVIDLDISRFVTEYPAEILENAQGRRIVAPFPDGVDRPVQYGPSVKTQAVYLSAYQLLPYERIREYFEDQAGIPLSAGSLFNFNREAFDRAAGFEYWVKDRLTWLAGAP
jgi:transposase